MLKRVTHIKTAFRHNDQSFAEKQRTVTYYLFGFLPIYHSQTTIEAEN